MRIGALLGITIAVAACGDSPVAPLRTLDRAPTLASSEWERSTQPFEASMFVSCANGGLGEHVDLTGELEISIHTVEDADGATRTRTLIRPSQVRGVGTETGTAYRGVGLTSMDERYYPDGEMASEKYTNIVRLVGQGKGGNLHMHVVAHVRYDENGNVVHEVGVDQVTCK